MMLKYLILLIQFFLINTLLAQTYYVSPSGNASWSAATDINTPCSLSTANDNVSAGDTLLLRGGTYTTTLNPDGGSGTATESMVFMNYPGETPIIDVQGASNYCIDLRDANYTLVKGITVQNPSTNYAIVASGHYSPPAHNITIDSCFAINGAIISDETDGFNVLNCSVTDSPGAAIVIYGTEFNKITNTRIEGCVIENSGSDGITLHANSGGFNIGNYHVIKNNIVRNVQNENCYDLTSGSYITLEGNTCEGSVDPGISVGHTTSWIRIKDYTSFNSSDNSEHIYLGGHDLSNVIVSNSVFYGGGENAFQIKSNYTPGNKNIRIFNNTIDGRSFDDYSIVQIQDNTENLAFKNNILYFDGYHRGMDWSLNPGDSDMYSDFDLYWHTAQSPGCNRIWSPDKTLFNVCEEYKRECNGIENDPLFKDITNHNYSLQFNSPAKDGGDWLAEITSASGSGISFTVDDPLWFYDGWNIIGETGDVIKTESGEIATIVSIDYNTKTITVDQAINWTQNEGISIDYKGLKPDMGAFEIQRTNYYVNATNGDDSNGGTTEATAWKTIDKVKTEMNNFNQGDSILFKRGEIWNGERLISDTHPSGLIDNPITYAAYGTGAKPIINTHIEQNPTWTDEGGDIWSTILVWTCGTRYFENNIEMLQAHELANLGLYGTRCYVETIDDSSQKLYVYSTINPDQNSYQWSDACTAIELLGANYINLSNIDIQGGSFSLKLIDNNDWNIKNCNFGKNSDYGIYCVNSSNIEIKESTFDSNFKVDMSQLPEGSQDYLGNSDGIYIIGGSSNIRIHHCYFKNWGHASFGSNADNPSDIVTGIKFYNNEITTPDILYGGRIGYSGYSENGEYYNNYIHNIYVSNQLGGSNNHFHHNIIDTLHDSPLSIGVSDAAILIQNYNIQIKDNIIENNIIANVESKGIELYSVNFDYPGMLTGNIIRNNILYNCGTLINDIAIEFNKDSSANIYNNIVENNLIYSDNTTITCLYQYGGTVYDVSSFNGLDDDIRDNIDGDPKFVNALTGDFHLQNNSPCIDAGIEGEANRDYDNNPIPLLENYDIGTYEYGIYWNGNVSNDWHTVGNWSNNQIPTLSDSVTIPPSSFYKNHPEVNNTAQVKKIYMNGDGQMIIKENKVFEVVE